MSNSGKDPRAKIETLVTEAVFGSSSLLIYERIDKATDGLLALLSEKDTAPVCNPERDSVRAVTGQEHEAWDETPGSDGWLIGRLDAAQRAYSVDDQGRLIATIPRELALLLMARLEGMDVTQPSPEKSVDGSEPKTPAVTGQELVAAANEIVALLARSRRSHGYVIAGPAELDGLLERYLSAKDVAPAVTGQEREGWPLELQETVGRLQAAIDVPYSAGGLDAYPITGRDIRIVLAYLSPPSPLRQPEREIER